MNRPAAADGRVWFHAVCNPRLCKYADPFIMFLQPAPGQRSKEKFVSLPEVDEDIESQLSIPETPPTLFEVSSDIVVSAMVADLLLN